jgi:hypothetical protein
MATRLVLWVSAWFQVQSAQRFEPETTAVPKAHLVFL